MPNVVFNRYEYARVVEVGETDGRVKVSFLDKELVSDWTPVLYSFTGADKISYMPHVGDIVVFFPRNEDYSDGLIVGGIYTDANPPVGDNATYVLRLNNGTEVNYNVDSEDLSITLKGDSHLSIEGDATIKVSGNISVNSEANVKVQASGAVDVIAGGDVDVVAAGKIRLGDKTSECGVLHSNSPCILFGIPHENESKKVYVPKV